MGAIRFFADGWLGRRPPGLMPQLEDGARHGFEISRFSDFWPHWGDGDTPQGSPACAGVPLVVEFGSLAAFFSTSIKKLH